VTAEASPDDRERGEAPADAAETTPASDDDTPNRRRGRRGGRRRRREGEGEMSPFGIPGADQPDLLPVYAGPTPADPFGGRAFDIFDVMDQAERAAEAKRAPVAIEIVNEAPPEPETSYRQPEPILAEPVTDEPAPVTTDAAAAPPDAEPEHLDADIVNTAAPEPVGETLPHPEPAAAETPVPANDTDPEMVTPELAPPEPLVKPILVGAGGDPPAEPRRGWWRR
jgi:ribonuclease E